MVRMTNGVDTVKVSAGSMAMFIRQGYHVIGAVPAKKAKAEVPVPEETQEADTEAEAEEEAVENTTEEAQESEEQAEATDVFEQFAELLDKPVSGWNKTELKEFSEAAGIDTSSAKNVAAAKKIVSEWLEENA